MAFILAADTHQMEKRKNEATSAIDRHISKIGKSISYKDAARIFGIEVDDLRAIVECSEFEKKVILRQLHKTTVQKRVQSATG